jgi:hypothetical protein
MGKTWEILIPTSHASHIPKRDPHHQWPWRKGTDLNWSYRFHIKNLTWFGVDLTWFGVESV